MNEINESVFRMLTVNYYKRLTLLSETRTYIPSERHMISDNFPCLKRFLRYHQTFYHSYNCLPSMVDYKLNKNNKKIIIIIIIIITNFVRDTIGNSSKNQIRILVKQTPSFKQMLISSRIYIKLTDSYKLFSEPV
jgi:hypothetical protein